MALIGRSRVRASHEDAISSMYGCHLSWKSLDAESVTRWVVNCDVQAVGDMHMHWVITTFLISSA